MFKLITDWVRRKHKCAACGTKTAMKHEMRGKTYCNRCAILASLREDYSRREKNGKECGALRQTITQVERDYCEAMNDYYTGVLFERLAEGKISDTQYSKYYDKLGEWESRLETLSVSEVSDHR